MATYKELRDAVAARVNKLNWTAYETNHTSSKKIEGSVLKMLGGNTQPRVIALNLDAVDVNFEKEWHNCDKMSSTYIKAPIANAVKDVNWAITSTDANLFNLKNTRHFGILGQLMNPESDFNYLTLTSVDEVNAWFDKFEKLKDYFIRQISDREMKLSR